MEVPILKVRLLKFFSKVLQMENIFELFCFSLFAMILLLERTAAMECFIWNYTDLILQKSVI